MSTPMMQQFHDAKARFPGMLVLFRNGDFYELFKDDAEFGAKILGLTLTKRDKEIPMAGFPYHKLEHYLGVLLKAGHRVAVCEQMEESGPGKKLIRREVNRVVTPGTVTDEGLLDPHRPNHLAAVSAGPDDLFGLAWIDLSSGSFHAADVTRAALRDELARLGPAECLYPESGADAVRTAVAAAYPQSSTVRPAWTFDSRTAGEALLEVFGVTTLAGFGFEDDQPCLAAAGAIVLYLRETLNASLDHVRTLSPHRTDDVLVLDEVTRRSLELTRTLRENQREGSLVAVLDRTVTPMGARYFHEALLAPLVNRTAIVARHDAVEELAGGHTVRGRVRELLDGVADLQRLAGRASTGRATPKDLAAIARTLALLPNLKITLAERSASLLKEWGSAIEPLAELQAELVRALVDDPPYSAKEGGLIREGYQATLDELRKLARDGKDWIARYQAEESTRTGIASLKVGFTDVMGYYIEITNANETRVPPEYVHERTLKGAKRFSTPRLKEYEEKVVTAQERADALELELFQYLREFVAGHTAKLLQTADALAAVDFLAGLAELAVARNYVRPKMVDEPVLIVVDGRHPVLDHTLPAGTFVPNDVRFVPTEGTFWLITGPNMSGKSTFIRQVALLTLLAHVGSFVPAKSATVGMTDRIFTRVGASDELGRGQSTFMVEMTEAANILNNATKSSLVILDEIGRGTSTYDGLSLAWAITEHLHDVVGCRTLFATHYHELTGLAEKLPRLRNQTVQVEELETDVIFLHKIAPGNAGKSYGIHVARLAGVPEAVLRRAEDVLIHLETHGPIKPVFTTPKPAKNGSRKRTPMTEIAPPEGVRRKEHVIGPSLFGESETTGE